MCSKGGGKNDKHGIIVFNITFAVSHDIIGADVTVMHTSSRGRDGLLEE
jgi:hypothetical protein